MPDLGHLRYELADPETHAWLMHVLSVTESLDPVEYTRLMTQDVRVRLADGSSVNGRDAVAAALTMKWASLLSLRHEELLILGSPRQVIHEARVATVDRSGEHSAAAVLVWMERDRRGRIRALREYTRPDPGEAP